MKKEFILLTIAEALFALLFFLVGLVNIFWGNDQLFGLSIIIILFVYLAPFRRWVKNKTGIWIAVWVRQLIAVFMIWSSLGVGELIQKIDMMMEFFKLTQTK